MGCTRRRPRLIAVLAVFFTASTGALAAPADVTRLPEGYAGIRQQLVASCGPARAAVIASLVWDIDIHNAYARVVKNNPEQAKLVGDESWHAYWISVYRHAIALLTSDCSAERPA
jgi:hypothetical protein